MALVCDLRPHPVQFLGARTAEVTDSAAVAVRGQVGAGALALEDRPTANRAARCIAHDLTVAAPRDHAACFSPTCGAFRRRRPKALELGLDLFGLAGG